VTVSVGEADVLRYFDTLSNWGRWGADDQAGTLNLITPEKRLGAARLIRNGVAISCSRTISHRREPDNLTPMLHHMVTSGEGAPTEGWGAAIDWVGMEFHGFGMTHIDSLAHIFWNGRMYNGQPASRVRTATGCDAGSVELACDGIVSRGVLLDIARAKSREWLEPGEPIFPEDLDSCETAQGVRVGPGDLLFVRTGRDRRRAAKGPLDVLREGYPGLHGSCLPWLRERDIAVLGSDMTQDVRPSGFANLTGPIHAVGIVAMGLWLVDNADLEKLAEACGSEGRWEFFMSIGALPLKRATGSPVNPIVVM
jgi:kynurenine formamidase